MRQRDVLGDEDFDYLFADDSWWDDLTGAADAPVGQVDHRRRAAPNEVDRTTVVRGPATPPASATSTIAPRPRPWYRSKKVLLAAAGAIAVAAVVIVVRAVDAADDSRTSEPPPAEPVPSTVMSTRVSVPPTPAVPAPPPRAPSASQLPTPGVTDPYPGPRTRDPSPTDGPEIGVTRTPVTRKPISVSPPPPPPPQYNQGDGRGFPF